MKEEKDKLFYLSAEEKANLQGRKAIMNQWSYIAKLITTGVQEDMTGYVEEVVKKRLSIPADKMVETNIEAGTIKVLAPKLPVEQKENGRSDGKGV